MDECRKDFEAGWNAAYSNMDDGGPTMERALERHLEARTEAKVSGEVVKQLKGAMDRLRNSIMPPDTDQERTPEELLSLRFESAKAMADADWWVSQLEELPAPQSPVVPGVDVGWVRSILMNMKPSEIDSTAHLIYDTFAHLLANVRESREAVLLEALVKARDYIEDGSPLPDVNDPYWATIEAIDKALATVGKEG